MIIETDPVVVGDGISPTTEFPETERRGLQGVPQKDDGPPVDEYLGVRRLEDVFTIGDIAVYPQTSPQSNEDRTSLGITEGLFLRLFWETPYHSRKSTSSGAEVSTLPYILPFGLVY